MGFIGDWIIARGKAGGQTLIGGTSASNDLTLRSTSNTTKGKIYFGNNANSGYIIDDDPPQYFFTFPYAAPWTGSVRIGAAGTTGPYMAIGVNTFDIILSNNLIFRNANLYYNNQSCMNWDTSDGVTAAPFASTTVAFNVKGAASQSANLLNAKNSSNTVLTYINSAGNLGVRMGATAATAYLHIAAGTASASTAPLKLTSGTVNTTAEAGAIEYNNKFQLTESDAVRRYIVQAAASTETTAGAPYTNSGYVEIVINGTTLRLMTTAG